MVPDRPELSVFLSYSRADLAFAEQLSYSLGACGVSVAVDHAEIQGGESWKDRLRQMILEADCVVFVLSPSSAASSAGKADLEEVGNKNIIHGFAPICFGILSQDTAVFWENV